ncbi:MAG: hypothetical protein K2N94_07435 [Lachnospiraceae bacterium]|nr:hypothetical protein [Lachnospiraceae bacterium]
MIADIQFDELAGGSFFEVAENLFQKLLPETWPEGIGKVSILLLALGLAAGIVQCLFGFKLRKIWTAIVSAAACGLTGAAISVFSGLGTGAVIGIGIGAAVVGGLLGYFLWFVGIFLRVFLTVAVCGFIVGILCGLDALGLIIALAAGLIAAILTVAFLKVMIIVYTSFAGGFSAAGCLFQMLSFETAWYLPLILGGAFAVVGLIVQAATNRRSPESGNDTELHGDEARSDRSGISESGQGALAAVFAKNDGSANGPAEEIREDGVLEAEKNAGPDMPATAATVEEEGGSVQGGVLPESAAPAENAAETGDDGSMENAADAGNADPAPGTAEEQPKRFCPVCGAGFPQSTKFCMKCGQKLV